MHLLAFHGMPWTLCQARQVLRENGLPVPPEWFGVPVQPFFVGRRQEENGGIFSRFFFGEIERKASSEINVRLLFTFFSEMMFVMKGNTLRNMCFFSISHFRFLVVNLRPVLYLHKYSMSKIIPCETSQIQHLIYDTPQCRRWQFPTFFSATCTKSWLLLRQKKAYMQMLVVWIQSLNSLKGKKLLKKTIQPSKI